MLKPNEKDVIRQLHEFNEERAEGISFAIAMRQLSGPAYDYDTGDTDVGEIRVYERVQQPCYGELRKYKETHGDGCTKPESKRPSDLFWPFPFGTPEALAIGLPEWRGAKGHRPMFDYLFSNESPFRTGFISAENIEWSKGSAGLVLLDTEFDPTVLINLLKYLQDRRGENGVRFAKYVKLGLLPLEAFVLDYSVNYSEWEGRMKQNDPYIFPVALDLQGVINQKPNALTGGTFKDRFDYDRKRMHEVFYLPEAKGGVNFIKSICENLGEGPYKAEYPGVKITMEKMVKAFKEVYDVFVGEKGKKAA